MYTNGLFGLDLNANIISFADDTLILVSGPTSSIVYNSATLILEKHLIGSKIIY